MVFSDILKLKIDGSIEELATYSLSGDKALNAFINQEFKKNNNCYEWKDNISPSIKQSKNNPRIWNLTLFNGDILSAIERKC